MRLYIMSGSMLMSCDACMYTYMFVMHIGVHACMQFCIYVCMCKFMRV